jgi:hypothetical protein
MFSFFTSCSIYLFGLIGRITITSAIVVAVAVVVIVAVVVVVVVAVLCSRCASLIQRHRSSLSASHRLNKVLLFKTKLKKQKHVKPQKPVVVVDVDAVDAVDAVVAVVVATNNS